MNVLGPSRRRLVAGAALALLLVVLVGRHFAGSSGGPVAQGHTALPADTATGSSGKLVVHVVGAVRSPGLYRLPRGARIDDAVRRAGGTTQKADLESINLAAPVEDGLQIVVPRRISSAPAGAPAGPGEPSTTQGKIHLNTASLEELESLPGVGPVTAQKILDYRQQHGAFTSIDDLDAISGIGPKRLEQLRDAAAP